MVDFTVLEDTELNGQLPGGADNLTFFPVEQTQTRDGVIEIRSDGSFTYQPDENFNGDDQFFFASVDEDGRLVGFGAIDIVVEAVNDAPVADPVRIVTDEDVAISGVLSTFDEENADLTFTVVEDDEDHLGVLAIRRSGGYTYTPDQDANGFDSFQFQVSDGEMITVASFELSVNPVNDAPVFSEGLDRFDVLEDTSVSIQVTANDPDMDAVEIFLDPEEPPSSGVATLSNEGVLTYTPNPNAPGQFTTLDEFGVIARDEQGAMTKATISPILVPVNDPPIVEDLSFEVVRGQSFAGQIITRDPDGFSRIQLEVSDDMPPSSGTVTTFVDFGSFTYLANDDAPMADSFTIIVIDGGFRVPALVEVRIVDPEGGTDEDDRLLGTAIADLFMGKDGSDTIFGLDGDDQLDGGSGADAINGGRGDDTIEGGGGSDTLIGEAGADLIQGGGGRDSLVGDVGADRINGGVGRDFITGGSGRDVLEGGGGRDIIEGDGGRDDMDGGSGFDILTGGRGADTLTGSGGNDRFVFDANHGRDVITDFAQGRDKIVNETGFLDFDLLRITQNGDDVDIRTGGGRVTIMDDDVDNFQASDFIF